MNDTQESLELTVLEHLDFTPGCQGLYHRQSRMGHNPDEPAAYLQVSPCGHAIFKCASNVAYLKVTYDGLTCDGCSGTHLVRDHRFIPL